MSASNFSPELPPDFSADFTPDFVPDFAPDFVPKSPSDSISIEPHLNSPAKRSSNPTNVPTGELADRNEVSNPGDRSGFEPELGANLRQTETRSGFEPELGGLLRQTGVYVDELTCIGCKHCALVARNTFYIEPDLGRARVVNQTGDNEDLIQEAIDTCPVNCIHWVDFTQLKQLEQERQYQVISRAGLPLSSGRSRPPKRPPKPQ